HGRDPAGAARRRPRGLPACDGRRGPGVGRLGRHALHTPLMSVTNAISGIIVVGALLQIGQENAVVTALSSGAILLACINIFGGFAVTRRMLAMFLLSP
ncbi:proton-translocating transhydrogenase family protein, partial [Streptomyces mirabilis]